MTVSVRSIVQRQHLWLAGVTILCGLVQSAAIAAPGDTLFYDDVNGNLNSWTVVANGGDAQSDNKTANQDQSIELRWGPVYAYTDPIAAAVPAAELSVWIRRGDDSFSEDPDSGEDLLIEYRDAGGAWNVLATFDGSGTPGEVYTPVYVLPAAALHGNLSIRFRLLAGNGSDNDYWHVDDPRVTERAAPGGGGGLGIGTCDDFESGLGNWVVTLGGGSTSAGTSSQTANSPSNSLYTEGGVVTVTSNPIDLSAGSAVVFDVWVRRGHNSFSGRPDNNEDLVIEYLSNVGVWAALETFPGGSPPGEIFIRSYNLPTTALHAGFQVRFRQTGGSGNSDYWHVDDVCFTAVEPVAYSFEEAAWTGAPGEVLDSSANALNGTVFGGAVNDDTTPALSTNPGTCRYGDFDGVNDYIEIADDPALDMVNELTVAVWINMRTLPNELHTIVSKDTNYEFHVDNIGRVYWWWQQDSFRTATPAVALNQWHHVAITFTPGNQVIYVDGVPRAANNYNGQLTPNNLPFFIGTDWNFISRAFDGYIDEVTVQPRALSAVEMATLMAATHPCAAAAVQFTINHDNFGINCLAETIIVDVVDSITGTPVLNYNATVQLDTQSGTGTWTLVAGSGTLTDATANDGLATYDWPLGESQAQFSLYYPEGVPSIDVDVYQVSDPGIRDTDAEGNLVFSPNGFTLTATPLSNPLPAVIVPFAAVQTAAVPYPIYLAAYGQTPNDPVCGVIESYAGNRNLEFWSQYLDPATGTRAVTIDGNAIGATEPTATAVAVNFVNGQAGVTGNYKDVGSKQILVKDASTMNVELPVGIRGATAGFVVRPADFVLSNIRNGAGTVINPQAGGSGGPVFIPAGADFRATVTAFDAEGDPTPNFGQESTPETVRLDPQLFEPAGGANPPVSAATGFGAFAGGSATGTDFTWSEVGIMQLSPAVGDGDYLGAGDVVGTLSERVGRFVPSHFAAALNAPMFQTSCAAGGYTYIGEAFNYGVAPVITATAQAVGNTTALNYTGAYFRLATATLANRTYSAIEALDLSGVPLPAADPAVMEIGPGIAQLVFSGGMGLSFVKAALVGPFDADIQLSIDVIDADGAVALTNPVTFGAGSGIPFNAGEEMRYGRLRFTNAIGSELVNLSVPLIAEYFAGANGFVPNVDDSCTNGITLGLGGFAENLNAGETCALDSGFPGASNIGCAAPAPLPQRFREPPVLGDMNLTLAAPGPTNTGSVTITSTVPAWLRFDWNVAAPGEENPAGQATFGLYSGDSQQIYIREVY